MQHKHETPSKSPIQLTAHLSPFYKANTATPAATTNPTKLVATAADAAPVCTGGLLDAVVALAAAPVVAPVAPLPEGFSETGTVIEPVG